MKQYKLAVLGCGNMASAIIKGLAATRHPHDFYMYTPTYTRAKELAKTAKGTAIKELRELPACDFYLIACKPQHFADLATELNPVLPHQAIIVSVMAGVTTTKMKERLPNAQKFSRTMPNTPCMIGQGVTGIFFTPNMLPKEQKTVEQIFIPVSKVFIFEKEEALDVTVAATGSGPAYVFAAAEHMIQVMSKLGIAKETAEAMVKQLFVGSALLMSQSEDAPESLRQKVTSKGGTTEAAFRVLDAKNWGNTLEAAVEAAYQRAKELSQ